MENNSKKKVTFILLLAVKAIAKSTTLALPGAVGQLYAQEIIDAINAIVLDLPDGFPTVESVLSEEPPKIQFAVNDILNDIDISNNITIIFEKGPIDTSNLLFQQFTEKFSEAQYDEQESQQIRLALALYIKSVRSWSVSNKDALSQHLDAIYSAQLKIKEDLKSLQATQKAYQQAFGKLEKVSLCDYRQREGDAFCNYFGADSSYTIHDFFLFDNYRKCVLSDELDTLDELEAERENRSSRFTTEKEIDEIKSIIEAQKILLVTGLYGTGKTSLLKKIYLEFEKDGNKSLHFFRSAVIAEFIDTQFQNVNQPATSHQIKGALKSLGIIFEGYINNTKQTIIFIDELEELNISCGRNTSYLETFLEWLCEFQKDNSTVCFLLASRKYLQIGKERTKCIADVLFEEYYFHNSGKEMTIIRTKPFSNEARNLWVQNFSRLHGKPIAFSEVKASHGKIAGALSNPLFLFAFMRIFLKEYPSHQLHGYYCYYSSFIKETISGRYGKGQKANTFLSEEEYYKILREIAFNILVSQGKIISAEIYKENIQEEQPILADDLTSRKFEMNVRDLIELIPGEDYQKASALNCYFLNMDKRRVYFTDTNILFALAAEHIFYSIKNIVETTETNENGEKTIKPFDVYDLDEIKLVQLYPQLIDYVIYLAKRPEIKNELFSYLISFVQNKFIQSHHVDLSGNRKYWVERIILLYILFIKINENSYKEYPNLFASFFNYIQAYKMSLYGVEKKKIYTVERYFMGIDLNDVNLERIDLRSFNFQKSKIKGKIKECPHITQCDFTGASFKNVSISNAVFELCKFNKVSEFSITEEKNKNPEEFFQVTFQDCRILNSNFKGARLIFKNCTISGLEITLEGKKNLIFEHCTIQKLRIKSKNTTTYKPRFDACTYLDRPQIEYLPLEDIKKITGFTR